MKKFLPTIVIVALVLVLVGFVVFALSRPEEGPSTAQTLTPQDKDALKLGASQGNPASSVVLTEFGDYQCPACAQWHTYVKDSILPNYQEKILFVFKNFPLTKIHKNAQVAAQAAEAAALQNQFWPMHNKLYETQKDWENDADPKGRFEGYAREVGLDVDRYKQDFESAKVRDLISADIKLGEKLGLPGTPSFLINGVLQNPKSLKDLTDALDKALAQPQ